MTKLKELEAIREAAYNAASAVFSAAYNVSYAAYIAADAAFYDACDAELKKQEAKT
jgi:hypothetical protein